jgi:hypothetical protein
MNSVMALVNDDIPQLNKQKPFPRKEERASVCLLGNDEIGLLDIVFYDAIANHEACIQ